MALGKGAYFVALLLLLLLTTDLLLTLLLRYTCSHVRGEGSLLCRPLDRTPRSACQRSRIR
jgi:hypothetical protein